MIGKLRRWIIPLAAGLFILLGLAYLASGKSGIGGAIVNPITNKHLVSCDVDISNKLASSPKIESFHCEKRSACVGLLSLPNPLGIVPKDTVRVFSVADDGSKSAVVKLDITEQVFSSTSKRVELNACTTSTAGQIKLLNNNDEIIDSKNWNVAE